MTYRLQYSPEAEKDMEDIWDSVWNVSKDFDTADNYVDDLHQKISEKKKAPKTGIPLYYRDLFTGFYYIHFKSYNAFYRINEKYIEVIRVLPSKMDYMKSLFGE